MKRIALPKPLYFLVALRRKTGINNEFAHTEWTSITTFSLFQAIAINMALIGREFLIGRTLSSVVSSTATPTVTTAPAITACSLVNQDATTFNDPLGSVVSLSSTIACA
jgi:hypothetical protein